MKTALKDILLPTEVVTFENIDNYIDAESENPVANKTIYTALHNRYAKNETSSAVEIAEALTEYYKKTETSSAAEITEALENLDLSEYYKKTETSSDVQLDAMFSTKQDKVLQEPDLPFPIVGEHVTAVQATYSGFNLSTNAAAENQTPKLQFPVLTADAVIATTADIIDTTDLVTKSSGGSISADVEIFQHDLNILSGRFSGGENSVANGKSTFVFGDAVSAIGDNSYAIGKNSVAGCYGWYYAKLDKDAKVFYLSASQPQQNTTPLGTLEPIETFDSGLAVGDVISFVNYNKYDIGCTIVAINGNAISVDALPTGSDSSRTLKEPTPNHDDWALFCPKKPTAGEVWFGEASYAEGLNNKAINAYSHAEGKDNLAYGQYSHVEGRNNEAGYASHAEGKGVKVYGQYSHGEGLSTEVVIGTDTCAHAEGRQTTALDKYAHAEGYLTKAKLGSHSEGFNTKAYGDYSHSEGNGTNAYAKYSHAEGSSTFANGDTSHVEGYQNTANGYASHAEGQSTIAAGNQSHAEGAGSSIAKTSFKISGSANTKLYNTSAAHELKVNNIIEFNGKYAKIVSIPSNTSLSVDATLDATNEISDATINVVNGIAYRDKSHSEGQETIASGLRSHAEGYLTVASGESSHAEGKETYATGYVSHAEGLSATASGEYSHAEGVQTTASGNQSHAEGRNTTSSGERSHAEGTNTLAKGNYSHAEGESSKAYGQSSHAEGSSIAGIDGNTNVKYVHAEGYSTKAQGKYSHTEGYSTITQNQSEHAQGQFNKSNKGPGGEWGTYAKDFTLHSIGFGASESTRKNAIEVMQNGDVYIFGIGGYDGTNPGSAQSIQQVINSLL